MHNFSDERTGMAKTRLISAIVATGVVAAGLSAGIAWAGGPGGVVEDTSDISEAVGTGAFQGVLEGFHAFGATNDEAAANVAYLKQMLARKDNPRTAARGKPPVMAQDQSD